jgi:hypothetical protein
VGLRSAPMVEISRGGRITAVLDGYSVEAEGKEDGAGVGSTRGRE